MEEISEYSQERKWQSDSHAFLWKVAFHWENLGTAIFGCAAISLWAGRSYVIAPSIFAVLANICFLIACFRAWRDERRAKEKAQAALVASQGIPDISGKWIRPLDRLQMDIEQAGGGIKSNFNAGVYDHVLNGKINPITRKFDQSTQRTNTLQPAARAMMFGTVEAIDGKLMICTFSTNGGDPTMSPHFNEVSILERLNKH